jgi:HEAT repeat protein
MLRRLIGLLAAASKEERRRAAEALIAIAASDEEAAVALRDALADPDANRRWGAAFVLYRAGRTDDGVFAGVAEALGADDGDVRWAAAGIAVALAASDADRRHRLRAIATDPTAAGRKMALYCLRDLGVNDERLFCNALTAAAAGVRLAAVSCLVRMSSLSSVGVDALLTAVEGDADAGVRRAAAVALGNARSDEARVRPVLERLSAQSTDPDLARAADRGLAGLSAARAAK